MNRGDVWEADIGGKIGKRPVLILTRSRVIPYLNKVTVAEITTQGKGYPTQVDINHAANLRKQSFVCTDGLHTIPKDRLVRFLGTLSPELLPKINAALHFALGMDE